jgi:hypothetical protein
VIVVSTLSEERKKSWVKRGFQMMMTYTRLKTAEVHHVVSRIWFLLALCTMYDVCMYSESSKELLKNKELGCHCHSTYLVKLPNKIG